MKRFAILVVMMAGSTADAGSVFQPKIDSDFAAKIGTGGMTRDKAIALTQLRLNGRQAMMRMVKDNQREVAEKIQMEKTLKVLAEIKAKEAKSAARHEALKNRTAR